MSNSFNERVEHLRQLLGPALLLPWSAGSKGDRRKWKHRQLTDMDDDKYLARLGNAGNIGVALGKVSDGLVTIDLDRDDYVEPLLEANPLLTDTLHTTAERGCNIWLRCTGEYPRSCKLRDRSGDEIGEWRADGNQTNSSGPIGALKLKDAARYLGVSPISVRRLIKRGLINPNRALRHLMIPTRELDRFLSGGQ